MSTNFNESKLEENLPLNIKNKKTGFSSVCNHISTFFGAITPISIILGGIFMYAYLSGKKSESYLMEAISSPSILITITFIVAATITVSGMAILLSLMILNEIKFNKKSLYSLLKKLYQSGNKLTVATLIFTYSTLTTTLFFTLLMIGIKGATWVFLTSIILLSMLISNVITWLYYKKESNTYITFLKHVTSQFSFRNESNKLWYVHYLFLMLITINMSSIVILISYTPQAENWLGKFQPIIYFAASIIINFLINYVYIALENRKKSPIIIASSIVIILATLLFLKLKSEEGSKAIRAALGLNDGQHIIISKETSENLDLSDILDEHTSPENYKIDHKHIIIKTNENIILKIKDKRLVSLPKSQVLGETVVINKSEDIKQ